MRKALCSLFSLILFSSSLVAFPFNDQLTNENKAILEKGEILYKNIKYDKYMCLKEGYSSLGDKVIKEIQELNPKYLAEVITYKPYEGNEDLPQKLEELLYNVSEYAGIQFYSPRHKDYFNLYDSAEIKGVKEIPGGTEIKADLEMSPFGIVNEVLNIYKTKDAILYTSINTNTLKFNGFDCVKPGNLKMCILLQKEGDKWLLYSIGGVNAPRIPFFTERIQTAFISRINTFCRFVFEQF